MQFESLPSMGAKGIEVDHPDHCRGAGAGASTPQMGEDVTDFLGAQMEA